MAVIKYNFDTELGGLYFEFNLNYLVINLHTSRVVWGEFSSALMVSVSFKESESNQSILKVILKYASARLHPYCYHALSL